MEKGKIFEALAQEDISKLRPLFCFVPERLLKPTFNQETYQKENWDCVNAGANAHSVGSHLFPDTTKEIDPNNPNIQHFLLELKKLIHKTKGPQKNTEKPPGSSKKINIPPP